MDLGKLFRKKSVIETAELLEAQNRNNLSVMNSMWFLFIVTWAIIMTYSVVLWKIFYTIVACMILVFISSLNNSIKQNKILILLMRK